MQITHFTKLDINVTYHYWYMNGQNHICTITNTVGDIGTEVLNGANTILKKVPPFSLVPKRYATFVAVHKSRSLSVYSTGRRGGDRFPTRTNQLRWKRRRNTGNEIEIKYYLTRMVWAERRTFCLYPRTKISMTTNKWRILKRSILTWKA
jgi:hypothetical protein